ncbi:MAG TPA: aspartyl protease family protein [Candidatus Rubrimentiphilum sp.]|nr:aspartyl protease family protein [Candidatus Rubrimentiphilum sp.]
MRTRSGGALWASAKELVAHGQATGLGLTGSTAIAIDLQSGATSTSDQNPQFRQQVVVAPDVTWKQDFTFGVHPVNSPDALAENRTSRYLSRRGYFRAADPAVIGCAADETENGRTLKRLQIVPKGGRPVTVWIDPQLPAIVRTQEQAPTHLSTVEYADFRSTHGLLLPYKITESDERPEDTSVRTITSYDVLQAANATDFQRPPEPSNQSISGSGATQMDVDVDSGSVIVNAYVNGSGPLPFILDTGGHAILTADAARQLGISGAGQGVSGGGGQGTIGLQFGRLQSLKLGDAELTDLGVFIIPYDKSFSDRGPGKTPLAGVLGLEIFERFVVTIDYAHHTLRLQTPQSYAAPPDQTSLPIVFQDDEPLTNASADGVPGLFGIDTGNSGRTVLFGDFLRNHGFLARYNGGAATQSSGTGGAVYSTSFRLRELTFGGLTMHDFVTAFVSQQTGSFSSRTEAGNIGHDVLAQFTVTFDYSRGRMYVHPEPGAPLPTFSRAGFGSFGRNSASNTLVVQSVLPNSPAADAGFAAGDSITAIDGVAVASIPSSRLRELTRQPAGTQLHFTVVKSTGATVDIMLTLRDLLCNDGKTTCPPRVTPAKP